MIERVKRIHGRVRGIRPDGVPYEALDPELIAWVHTCIPWAIMTAFDRFHTPLTDAEKDQYLREQAVIGRMGGADWVPEDTTELAEYVESMRGRMAMNDQTRRFRDFLVGATGGPDAGSRREQAEGRLSLRLSMSLMPDWARHLTTTWHPRWFQRLAGDPIMRAQSGLVRWAYPEPPCVQLARDRVSGDASVRSDAAA